MRLYLSLCALCIACIVFFAQTVSANERCISADPENSSDVFECISTATVSQYNSVNPFGMMPTTHCNLLQETYRNVLLRNGLDREQALLKTPRCSVFASAIEDLNGEAPLWSSCLGYDGSAKHMMDCLSNVLRGQHSDRSLVLLANCASAYMLYEQLLRSVADPVRSGQLPEPFARVECDAFLTLLSATDEAIDEQPCAGFSGENINAHVEQCLLSEPRLQRSKTKLTCQMLRQAYQAKLITVYGKIPKGFRLLPCSVLNPIADELLARQNTP